MGLEEQLYTFVIGIKEIFWLLIIIIILVAVIIALKVLEKRFRKVIELRKNSKSLLYRKEIRNLKNYGEDPERLVDSIDNIARNFFKDAFDFDYNLEYSELAEKFTQLKKEDGVNFCNLMFSLNYSGEKIDREKLAELIDLLDKIIRKNRIPLERDILPVKLEAKKPLAKIKEQPSFHKKKKSKFAGEIRPFLLKKISEREPKVNKQNKEKFPEEKLY